MSSDTGGIIRPIGYNFKGEQDESLVTEDSFIVDQPFLVILNKPLPKYSKLYIEITVTSHPDNPKIRYIPLYFGVHKEPSFGILNADFCMGNVYYTTWSENIDFDIMERYDAAGKVTHTNQHDSEWKIPILNTTIGLGVDLTSGNKIEIYSDGNLFYSFTPKTWILNKQEDSIYFSIYGLFYEKMEAYINIGKYKTKYLPNNYWTLYDQYYSKNSKLIDIPINFLVTGNENVTWKDKLMDINMNIENDIAPLNPNHKRDIYLINKYPSHMDFEDNLTHGFNIISKYNPLNGIDVPSTASDITSINLPIPNDAIVYYEFHIAEGIMNKDILGIPVSVGIADSINNISNKSVRINLWHNKYDRYKVYRYKNNVESVENAGEILNPSTPTQPNTVGVLYDLHNNKMTITVEGNIFTIVDLSLGNMNFSNIGGLYYAFIKCEDYAFTGDAYGICNFGEEKVEYTLDENEMTIYDYYNAFIKFPADPKYLDIIFNALPYKIKYNRHFNISFIVTGSESSEEKMFSAGLNKLFDTYNIVSDTESYNNEPDQDIFDFEEYIENDLTNTNTRKEYLDFYVHISFIVR